MEGTKGSLGLLAESRLGGRGVFELQLRSKYLNCVNLWSSNDLEASVGLRPGVRETTVH